MLVAALGAIALCGAAALSAPGVTLVSPGEAAAAPPVMCGIDPTLPGCRGEPGSPPQREPTADECEQLPMLAACNRDPTFDGEAYACEQIPSQCPDTDNGDGDLTIEGKADLGEFVAKVGEVTVTASKALGALSFLGVMLGGALLAIGQQSGLKIVGLSASAGGAVLLGNGVITILAY